MESQPLLDLNPQVQPHTLGSPEIKVSIFKILSSFIRSICDNFEIPHVKTRWNVMVNNKKYFFFNNNLLLQAKHAEYSVNLAPHPRAVTRAFRDLILAYGWRSVLCDALPSSVFMYFFSGCSQFFMKKVKPSSVFRLVFVS